MEDQASLVTRWEEWMGWKMVNGPIAATKNLRNGTEELDIHVEYLGLETHYCQLSI